MKKILLASIVVFGFSTPAFAQDFAGPRAELRVGYDSADVTLEDDGDELSVNLGDGINYGAEIGFDAQLASGIVLGAYAGLDFSNLERCEDITGDGDDVCIEAGRNITGGVRAGVAVTPNALLYAKGGYSNGQLKARYEGPFSDDFDDSGNGDGWHLGAGAELGFGMAYAKVEYVYTDYTNSEFGAGFDDEGDVNDTVSVGLSRHQVLVGLGVRF